MAERTWLSLFHTELENPDLQGMMASLEQSYTQWALDILTIVVRDTVAYLKSYTSRRNPPRGYTRRFTWDETDYAYGKGAFRGRKLTKKQVHQNTAWRPAHPGNWSDVSGLLAAKYYGRVYQEGNKVIAIIGNTDEKAVFVEAKYGYFVVTGVMEPNGPVVKAMQRYMNRYAPGTVIQDLGLQDVDVTSLSGNQPSSVEGVIATRVV